MPITMISPSWSMDAFCGNPPGAVVFSSRTGHTPTTHTKTAFFAIDASSRNCWVLHSPIRTSTHRFVEDHQAFGSPQGKYPASLEAFQRRLADAFRIPYHQSGTPRQVLPSTQVSPFIIRSGEIVSGIFDEGLQTSDTDHRRKWVGLGSLPMAA